MRSKRLRNSILISFLVLALVATAAVLFVGSGSAPPSITLTINNPSAIPLTLQEIHNEDDGHGHANGEDAVEKIADVDKTEKHSVHPGNYCLSVNSVLYVQDDICVEVKDKPVSVEVNPDYSIPYLESLLPNELPKVRQTIRDSYKEIISDFTFADDRLFKTGQWYGLSLTKKVPDPSDRGDVYLVILEKIEETWTIKDIPRLAVNKYQLPDVPISVLDEVNRMPGSN